MNEQAETKTPERPEQAPFQFGLKHLLAVPAVVAMLFGTAAWIGLDIWVPLAASAYLVVVSLATIMAVMLLGRPLSPQLRVCVAGAGITVLMILYESTSLQLALERGTPRSRCGNNLKRIACALDEYHAVHGCFPPAYIADENGLPMHSWRVLILPYLDRLDVYEAYDFDEPWNGPNNRKLAEIAVSAFDCPAEVHSSPMMTNYLAVVGPDTAWPGSEPTSLADFAHEKGSILHVVEVAHSGIHWMSPRDLQAPQMAPTVNSPSGRGISSSHPDGANAAFADGSVRFLPENTWPEQLRAMLIRSGNESVDTNDITD